MNIENYERIERLKRIKKVLCDDAGMECSLSGTCSKKCVLFSTVADKCVLGISPITIPFMTEIPKNIDSEIALLEKQKIADGEAHVDFTCRGCAGFEGCREDDMRHHLEKDYEVCENWRPR